MLAVVDGAGFNMAGEALHREMERVVVVLDGAKVIKPGNADMELLVDLADASVCAGFAGLELSSGEFPAIFELAVSTLCGKDLPVPLNDGGCDMDCLHWSSLSGMTMATVSYSSHADGVFKFRES